MADENTILNFTNGNYETNPSPGNELLYFTAESDILNVSNDSVNQCLLKTQNENINCSTLSNDSFHHNVTEKSGDSNRNSGEDVDLSITDAFAKMMLSNNIVNDVTMKTMSCSSEPLDNISDNIVKDEFVQQPCSETVVEGPLKSIEGESPNVNMPDFNLNNDTEQSLKKDLVPENNKNILPAPVNISNPVIDDEFCKVMSPVVGNDFQNMELSPESKTDQQSTPESFAAEEKIFSPTLSGSMLSEQALSFMVGCDSSNEFSSSLPNKSLNVSDHENNIAVKQDVQEHLTEIDLLPQNTNVNSNIVSTNDEGVFKIPAIPVKVAEPKAISPVDTLGDDSGGDGLPLSIAKEMPGFPADAELPPDNFLAGQSDLPDDKNDQLFDSLEPCKLSEVEVPSSGLPEPRVFTDFREENKDTEDNLFKVPEPPKDDDEEFTDAVQFFKDPSSFQYLENIQTSVPVDSIPRSSLYVAFDPLHSKRVSVSQMLNTPVLQLPTDSDSNISTPVKKHLVDASLRESLGVLISFDSPKPSTKVVPEENEPPTETAVTKQYTEEELQQILKINELTMQDTYLKKHREFEEEMAKAEVRSRETIKKLSSLVILFKNSMEELSGIVKTLANRNVELESKADELEKENEKLKDDVKTAGEDLQSVESTFSDFHKRYEQCKGMLKTYKENEAQLKAKLSEQEQKYNTLQEQSHEALEKASLEATVAKKSSEGQVTVLKAQLKKAELKISSLESDLSQVKIENSKLGGICDDLMAKVSEG